MTLTYAEALDYLYGFINYEQKAPYRYSTDTYNLARVRSFMARLGDPQSRFECIHIAGTKGKGSVAAMCESALRTAGYRVGLYTSPHLHEFRERIQVDRELISPEALAALVERIQPAIAEFPQLTWFEIVTGIAFLHFVNEGVDVAVLEVGLGGRLDSTNIVTPRVSVLTSISYDHMHLLGNTLAEIAGEKAGIIKPGVPVVSAPQQPDVVEVFRYVAHDQEAPLEFVGSDLAVVLGDMTPHGIGFTVEPRNPAPAGLLPAGPSDWWLPLTGEHQAVNGAVALLALDVLARGGLRLDAETVRAGLAAVQWAGRFQVIHETPTVVLDAAHNLDSAEKLAQTIEQLYPRRPLTLVFGASADKDIPGMLHALVPLARRVIVTRAPNVRAADPEAVADEVASLGVAPEIRLNPDEALALALEGAGEDDVIVITGSIFIIGAITVPWQPRQG